MHELALEQRRELGVRAPWHVGDITWGLRQHEGREDEWTIRTWEDDGRTVTWSWLKGDRGLLDFDVRRDRLDLLRARIYDHLGRKDEALAIYRDIVTRMPGEEARCRYAALLIEVGRKREALGVLEEVEDRMKRLDRHQRQAEGDMYRWATDKLRELRATG